MIEWFTKLQGSDIAPSHEDPKVAMVGDTRPDQVRTPPELGGDTVRVLGSYEGPCVSPSCHEHTIRHLELEDGIFVGECPDAGFLWHRRK